MPILESHKVHGLEFDKQHMKKGFCHVFALYISYSPVLPTASNPGNSQAMRWWKTVKHGVLKLWPSGCRSPPGRKGTSSREGWRSPVRSYNNVRVKIRMNGVSSLLRTNRKFHLWWSQETWNEPSNEDTRFFPPTAPTNLDWCSIKKLAFLFHLYSQWEPKRDLEYHISLGQTLQTHLSGPTSTNTPAWAWRSVDSSGAFISN